MIGFSTLNPGPFGEVRTAMGSLDELKHQAGDLADRAKEGVRTTDAAEDVAPVEPPPLAEPLGSDPLDAPTPGPYTAGTSGAEPA
jgi:hypothetical protein